MASDIQNEAIEWLAKLNRESLSEDDEAAFFAWLQQSEAHQVAFIKAEQLWLRGDVLSRATEALHTKASQTKPATGLWLGGFAMACCLAVAVVILWPSSPAYTELKAGNTIAAFSLPDGSEITLKAGSTLAYSFDKKSRSIRLSQGEAFFDVAHNPAKPFIVSTEFGAVKVLGTQFSVGLNGQGADVMVLSGSVEVAPDNNTQKAILTKNQAVSFQQVASGEKPSEIKAMQLLSWRHSQWVFENTPLGEAVNTIAKTLDRTVDVPASHADLPVTGVLPMDDPEQALKTLAASQGLVVKKVGGVTKLME